MLKLRYYLRNKIRIRNNNENRITIGEGVKMRGCTVTIRGRNNTLHIGSNVKLRDTVLEIMGEGCSIEIADGCMIGHRCYLSAKENGTKIAIGRDCGLSRNVKMMTSDGHPVYSGGVRINPAKSITLGAHVWVADNVTFLKGVTVGSGSVIGINALVTKSVPENCIAAGNPAKVVKEGIDWEP